MQFQEMPYRRVTLEEARAGVARFMEAFGAAQDAGSAERALRDWFQESLELETLVSLCYVRHSIDTKDKFYEEENDYYDEHLPLLQIDMDRANDLILGSPHRPALEKALGTLLFQKLENEKKQFSEAIVPQLQEENRLSTAYDKLLGSAELQFDGKTLNLSQMQPYRTSPDRDTRRAASAAYFGWFSERRETLDKLFDDLVRVRHEMAQKLGYKNYVALGYLRMQRFDYDAAMVRVYRDEVKRHLVPLVTQINERQRRRLGLSAMKYYDVDFLFPGGNPKPVGTPEELVAKAGAMYHALSPETGEFFDYMRQNNLMDLVAKPGKTTGGYCTAFPSYRAPFIFSNFNGTKDDVDVLTHEAGHALQSYLSMREIDIPAYYNPTYESCEIHSMSMELLTARFMEPFFGPDTEKFRYMQLVDILRFIPYGCLVDEFQHAVYENPDLGPAGRFAAWRELERQYLPDLDYDGLDYLEQGGRWQRQSHIYVRPFYYIDYTLAQICAIQFYLRFEKNDPDAWRDYVNLCRAGGKFTFLKLVELAGLASPFVPGVLPEAVAALREKLEAVDDSKF